MRDAVEEVHRAVDGIDDPLVFAVLVAADAFLAVDGVVGIAGEQERLDERLRALVEFELDVVGEVFIDLLLKAEVRAQQPAPAWAASMAAWRKSDMRMPRG